MSDGQGTDKTCVLTPDGLKKLEAALKDNFPGKRPSNAELGRIAEIDREVVAKILAMDPARAVARVSLSRLFEALHEELVEADYEQVAIESKAKAQPKAPNPFGATGVITDPTKFWGRGELLRQVFEELGKGGSRALIGSVGSGKSSILEMIGRLGPERLGRSPEEFVYLDMHMVRDEDDFFEALCEGLRMQACKQRQIQRELINRQRRYVLCLDEIHVLSNEAFFPEPTRNWLRGMAEMAGSPLQLVVASQRELRELFPDSPSRSSPLADFFDGQTTRVEYLTEVEVVQFWLEGLAGTGVIASEEQGQRLWAESRGEWRALQRSAAKLYDELCGSR